MSLLTYVGSPAFLAGRRGLGIEGLVSPGDVERPLFDRLFSALDDYDPDPANLSAVRAEVAGMITSLPRGIQCLVVFGDTTAGHVVATIYTEPGVAVFAEGRPTTPKGPVGGAEVQQAVVALPAGVQPLRFRLEAQGRVETFTRSVLVTPPAPQLEETLLNGFESEADLARMSLRSVTAALSSQHVTGGASSVELVFGTSYSWPGLTFDAATDLGGRPTGTSPSISTTPTAVCPSPSTSSSRPWPERRTTSTRSGCRSTRRRRP
ncbi:MAG TPA: hypothetical protein VIA06_06555 [Candidatus Dormibacteraeota bacterium]|jgi:hypothetical protein|nr:hypothetical protein [Candidatus Dormibacteraeota bacterium]